MKTTEENRKYQRFLVNQQLDCVIQFIDPQSHPSRLSDISEGGMMVLLSVPADYDKFAPAQEITGEIASDNSELQLKFSGRVAWKREITEGKRTFISLGIQFSPDVKLPEAILEMLTTDSD